MLLYRDDLAFIQHAGYGGLARGAAPAIVDRLRAAGARRVVDVGCGAGVLTRALVDAGLDVVAIDPSPELLAIARREAEGARFVQGSAYDTPIDPCDAVIALGEPLTYHAPDVDADARVDAFFAAASAALRTSGLLIFDVIELGAPSLATRNWAAGDDWAVLVETTEHGRHLTRAIETFRRVGDTYRRDREVHHVRLFDASSLTAMLERHGFAVHTATTYGDQLLPPRRSAFFAERSAATRGR